MNIEKFTGPGSTPSRRRFWDSVSDAITLSRKVEGRNVSVDEHQGLGTVINFPDQTPSAPVIACGPLGAMTADYTVEADFSVDYTDTTIKCCKGVAVSITAEATEEEVAWPTETPGLCDHRDGIKGGPGGAAPILTDCGDNLCYCGSIGNGLTWTSGTLTCGAIGDTSSICEGPHGAICCCPQEAGHGSCDFPIPCVADPIDILTTVPVGFPDNHLIDFIYPRAFLQIFRDLGTGDYVVIPTGFVMDQNGFAATYCYDPIQEDPQPLLLAMCALDYCRDGNAAIVLGPSLSGNTFDIAVSLSIAGAIMTPDCWGGALDGFCFTGFCGCCGLNGSVDFTWHVTFN